MLFRIDSFLLADNYPVRGRGIPAQRRMFIALGISCELPITMQKYLEKGLDVLSEQAPQIALKILGAFLLWVIGKKLIGFAVRLIEKGLNRNKFDKTLSKYLTSVLSAALTVILVVAMLGFFGVETTSFAALLAGAGLAIGMAWSGLLANFAAGAFLLVLRPIKVGDFVTVGGVTGTVVELGMFVTALDTPDNVRTLVGNNKIFSETIQNYSENSTRRVELVAQLAHETDHNDAIERFRKRLLEIPHVVSSPAPDVPILEFTLAGPVLAVRPHTHTDTYWDVYFATNKLIRELCGEAGYSVPETHHQIRKSA